MYYVHLFFNMQQGPKTQPKSIHPQFHYLSNLNH